MNDSNKPPKLPPDDFSKTTPNINIPNSDDASWGKTNYKYPAQPPSDDWGNTVANVRPFDNEEDEFGRTFAPSSGSPKVPDWGVTQSDINLRQDDFGADENPGAKNEEFGVTTPYFRLPESERAKYQNIPPTPTEEAKQKASEEKKKGIPAWVWISGGLFSMFLFAVVVLLAIFIIFWKTPGFEIIVKNAPAGSSVRVDDNFWGETTSDGSKRLPVLKSGQRNIEIIHPNYKCSPISIAGVDGDVKTVEAKCDKVASIADDCLKIKNGDYAKSGQCANAALDKLPETPSLEDLLRAMNLYINHFDSGKADIRPEDQVFLQKAAGFIKKVPQDSVIEVGGHTDSVGSDTNNQPLSERRATAVRNELIKAGVLENMLVMKGYGSKKPKVSNDTDDGKFQNRRIEYRSAK